MAVFQYLFSVSTLKSTNQRNCLKNVFYGIDHQSIKFYLFVHSWQKNFSEWTHKILCSTLFMIQIHMKKI